MEQFYRNHLSLADTLALLERTPASLDALLRGLSTQWIHSNEGGVTWTPFEVIAHLIDCEHTNWLPRARSIHESEEVQPFPPFARRTGGEEDKKKSLEALLDVFHEIRAANLAEVQGWNLQPDDLTHQGIHPVFGPVTLGQLLATWATHDLTHQHQIARTLASQQRKAVGPWIKYLGVLHCNGHSE